MNDPNRRAALQTIGGAVAGTLLTGAASAAEKTKSPPKIKVGQIGVGHAHATKLSVYRDSPDYEVVGLVEPDSERREKAKNHAAFRNLPWMTQEQLLNVPDLKVVLVETHVLDSLPVAETCIAAGKHIHLDKPAGASLPHFRRILDTAADQELLVQMGYMYRYNPGIVLLRDCLKKGWLGEPFEVHAVMSKVVGPESRHRLDAFSGGTMFELGCHLIDLTLGVMGPPDKITPFPKRVVQSDDSLIDNMLAVFEYPRATATVKSSAVEVEGFARRHFVVCGTEGTFHVQPLDDPAARVAFSQNRGKYKRGYQDIIFPEYTRYIDDAADMARTLRGEKEWDFPYAHDLAVQTAVLKASEMPLT